ncbi:hypothetical protein L3488_004290 [Salmonella enterica subsp. enterica serovar Agbeni]|nr:hypothetical protein [Salmonella enterica subsp. enterica serovar Agbeni]EIU1267286.1 hypothetical protein [Salmonella enterica subsp. enterica serovar Agbeni]
MSLAVMVFCCKQFKMNYYLIRYELFGFVMNFNKRTLRNIIDQAGGINRFSDASGFKKSTLKSWANGYRYPCGEMLALLVEYTGGALDVNALIETYRAKKTSSKKAGPRKLSACRLVADLDVLKSLFEELSLPAARLNLKAPAILRRWKTTHVTVAEVRAAVAELAAVGADSGDIELIHKTIGANRSAQLAALREAP